MNPTFARLEFGLLWSWKPLHDRLGLGSDAYLSYSIALTEFWVDPDNNQVLQLWKLWLSTVEVHFCCGWVHCPTFFFSLVFLSTEGLVLVKRRRLFYLDHVLEISEPFFPCCPPQGSISIKSLWALRVRHESRFHISLIAGVARSIVVLEDGVFIVLWQVDHVDLIFGAIPALIMMWCRCFLWFFLRLRGEGQRVARRLVDIILDEFMHLFFVPEEARYALKDELSCMRERLLSEALWSLYGKSLTKEETMALICASKLFSGLSSGSIMLIDRM